MIKIATEYYIERCFELAKKGLGTVSPNPLVGAVIVANDRIIGEGWHQQYGKEHAEVNALASVSDEEKHLLKEATIYVNLEPCNHFGNTPPCVDAILKHNIPSVVISTIDSNPKVGGKGIARLRENGVNVTTGILEKEGRFLNRRFFTFLEKKRPYIILKWAQTEDGFFAKNSENQTWISNQFSKKLVHKWRSEEDAILVGTTTAKIDNPKLTNRFFEAKKQPVRVVFDRDLSIPKTHHLFDEKETSFVVTEQEKESKNRLQYCHFEFDNNLIINTLQTLTQQNIQSIIIEGGAQTLQHFIDQNLWDEARIITSKTTFGEGLLAPKISGTLLDEYPLKNDTITLKINQ